MLKVIVFALVLITPGLLWRKWARQRQRDFIDRFRYRPLLDKRLAARHPELTPHQRTEVLASPSSGSEGLKRAWRLACDLENINPRHTTRLPRLFALDAKLGIVGGF